MIKRHKILTALILILFLCAAVVLYSPRYLLYFTDCRKADAIILLLGPDFKARQKEARDLLNAGMADYLIIPAYHKIYKTSDKGKSQYLLPGLYLSRSGSAGSLSYPGFYEDTHIEIIEAKKIMTDHGLQSAIFVSSPYHMRRIRLISGKVFGNEGYLYFVPTVYEKAPADFLDLSLSDWKKVRREYGKMLWFLIYYTWTEISF